MNTLDETKNLISATGTNSGEHILVTDTSATADDGTVERVKELHVELLNLEARGRSVGLEYGEAARKLGCALSDLNSQLPQGQKAGFYKVVPGLKQATAYRYIRLAERFPDKEALAAALGETESLSALYRKLETRGNQTSELTAINGGDPRLDELHVSLAKTRKSISSLDAALLAVRDPNCPALGTNEVEQIREIWKQVTRLARGVDAISDEEFREVAEAAEATEGGGA